MAKRESQFEQFGMPEGPSTGNPWRRAHLEFLHKLREKIAGFFVREIPYGAVALSIPELDYYVLLRRFPDLNAPDSATRTRAWKWFIRSPYSEPYRVKHVRKGAR